MFGDNFLECSSTNSPAAESTSISIPRPMHIEVVAVDAIATTIKYNASILTTGDSWGIVMGDSYSIRTLTPCFGKTALTICRRFPDNVRYKGQTFSYDYTGPLGYINGKEIVFPSDHNPSSIYVSRAKYTVIGCHRNSASAGYGRFFTGWVYSIRLYSRALSADEVAYNSQVDQERFGLQQ